MCPESPSTKLKMLKLQGNAEQWRCVPQKGSGWVTSASRGTHGFPAMAFPLMLPEL